MTIKIKVEFDESSKAVSALTKVESDELSMDEVLKMSKELALKAQAESQTMTMRKLR